MEIVVQQQEKFQKNSYHFNWNCQFKSDIKNDPIGHPGVGQKIRLPVLRIRLHPKTSTPQPWYVASNNITDSAQMY